MKSFYYKLAFLLGFVVVLFLIFETRSDSISFNAKAESNFTNEAIVNSVVNQNYMNTALNNSINHVIIVIMENKGYTQVIGSSDAPYQNELAKKYASASKYYGVYPDSLPNYLSIIAGYPYLTKDKDPGTMAPLKEPTIVNLLESKRPHLEGIFRRHAGRLSS